MKPWKLALSLGLALVTVNSIAQAQKAARFKDNRMAEDVSQAVQTIERLRKVCAQPKDAFESQSEALNRALASFNPPTVNISIKPLLESKSDYSHDQSRRWGGFIRGGAKYNPDTKQLLVLFPFKQSRGSGLSTIYISAAKPMDNYVALRLAEEGYALASFRGTNAFGVTASISHSRDVIYQVVFTRPEDVIRLLARTPEEKKSGGIMASIAPDEARGLVPALEWQVRATLQPYEGAKCVADTNEYTSRYPELDNPWREERMDISAHAFLESAKLVDKRTGTVLWDSESLRQSR